VSGPARVFLLSPAKCSGLRAEVLVNTQSALGAALRSERGAPIGEVFSFLSSLYFRGKLAYATRFGDAAPGVPSALVMAPGHGLCRASTRVRESDLAAMGKIDVDAENPQFVEPLCRDAEILRSKVAEDSKVVLLGSVATPKYVEPLLSVFGQRLLFPREFVGRGDMSRGGLMLRAAREGRELDYVAVQSAQRKGKRAKRIAEL
jgi:hypothetical protein